MQSIAKKLYRKISQTRRSIQFPYAKYNKKNNCIFIHIPKVAGTSITKTLGGSRAQRNHLPWYVYYTANQGFFEQSFKFSFVRNPWDRALSAYNYLKAGGNQNSDLRAAKMISEYDGFDDFIINGLWEGKFRDHLMFIPQSNFIVNGEQELVVDFLGRFENLEEDFKRVLGLVGINKKLLRTNSSKAAKNYRCFYQNSRSVEIISQVYIQDVKMFSYQY